MPTNASSNSVESWWREPAPHSWTPSTEIFTDPVGDVAPEGETTGDGNFTILSKVNVASYVVGKATPTTSVSAAPNGLVAGGPSGKITVGVQGPAGAPSPTGTVTVTAGGGTCKATLAAATSPTGSATGSCQISVAVAGTETIQLAYGGDASYMAASGSSSQITVAKEASATALSLNKTSVPVASQQSVLLSTTATPKYAGAARTGTVTITSGAKKICTITLVKGAGSCALAAKQLAKGSYPLVATYSGDANTVASTSTAVTLNIT